MYWPFMICKKFPSIISTRPNNIRIPISIFYLLYKYHNNFNLSLVVRTYYYAVK